MIEVRVDTDTLSQGASGSITGVISLFDKGWTFPESEWNDFPVVILAWWLEALSTLSHTGKPAECLFMDGSQVLRVSLTSSGAWLVECLASEDEEPVRIVQVQPSAFMRSLREASRSVVHACQVRGFQSTEVSRLAQLSLAQAAGA